MSDHPRHPQTVADPQPDYAGPEYYGTNAKVEVDIGIHTLLQVLWAKGFQTQFSCQGWPFGSEGAKYSGTRGYITFRTIEMAMDFWTGTYRIAAEQDCDSPNIVLETAIGLAEDFTYLDEALPPRGVVRFQSVDLPALEELWASSPIKS